MASNNKHPRCASCDTLFRGKPKRRPQNQSDLNIYTYLLGLNNKEYKLLTIEDRFCQKCFSKVNDIKRAHPESSEINSDEEVQPLEDTNDIEPIISVLDFSTMTDKNMHIFTGLTCSQFDNLFESCSSLRNKKVSAKNRLGMLLMKMRHDLPNNFLAALFGYSDDSASSKALKSVRVTLMNEFVVKNLGVNNLSREQVLSRVPEFSQKLYAAEKDKLVVIMDGTYIYTQKSNNYKVQRRFFSGQKSRPLIKPMMIVTTDGYIVDCIGPYVGANNDSSILICLMKQEMG